MKLFTFAVFVLLLSFNKTVAQSREYSLQINQERAANTERFFLTLSAGQKQLLTFNADLANSAPRLHLTVKDEAGNIQVQSLLQMVNDQLIQWQLTNRTKDKRETETKGEIRLFKEVQ